MSRGNVERSLIVMFNEKAEQEGVFLTAVDAGKYINPSNPAKGTEKINNFLAGKSNSCHGYIPIRMESVSEPLMLMEGSLLSMARRMAKAKVISINLRNLSSETLLSLDQETLLKLEKAIRTEMRNRQ